MNPSAMDNTPQESIGQIENERILINLKEKQ